MTRRDRMGRIGQIVRVGLVGALVAVSAPAWAQTGMTDSSLSQVSLGASAVYRGMDEWARMRTALSRLQGVSVSITAISVDGALIQFRFSGTFEHLQAVLKTGGLDLTLEANGAVVRLASS